MKNWKDTKNLLAISTEALDEAQFKILLGPSISAVASFNIVPKDGAVLDKYYNKIQFETFEAAKIFFTRRSAEDSFQIVIITTVNSHNMHI